MYVYKCVNPIGWRLTVWQWSITSHVLLYCCNMAAWVVCVIQMFNSRLVCSLSRCAMIDPHTARGLSWQHITSIKTGADYQWAWDTWSTRSVQDQQVSLSVFIRRCSPTVSCQHGMNLIVHSINIIIINNKNDAFRVKRDTEKRAESSDTVRANPSQEKLWFETPPEGSQWQLLHYHFTIQQLLRKYPVVAECN